MSAHTPEAIAQEERRYFQIFIWLGILTVLEIGVITSYSIHYTKLYDAAVALVDRENVVARCEQPRHDRTVLATRIAFGENITTTGIQMANAFCAVINGGIV